MEESKIVGFSIAPEYSKFIYELTNPEKVSEKPEALDGVVVLDLSYRKLRRSLRFLHSRRAGGRGHKGGAT